MPMVGLLYQSTALVVDPAVGEEGRQQFSPSYPTLPWFGSLFRNAQEGPWRPLGALRGGCGGGWVIVASKGPWRWLYAVYGSCLRSASSKGKRNAALPRRAWRRIFFRLPDDPQVAPMQGTVLELDDDLIGPQ